MKRDVRAAGAAVMMAAGLMFTAPVSARAAEPLPEGISAGGISLEGLLPEEAQTQVEQRVEEMLNQAVTLDIGGSQFETAAGELGASWKNEEQVKEALAGAEVKGNLINRYMKKKDLQVNPVDVPLEVDVDQEKITSFINEECGGAVKPAADAAITKQDGEFVITPSVVGTAVDMEATKEALSQALNSGETGGIQVDAAITEEQPKITTEDLSTIKDVLGTFTTDFKSSGSSRSTNLEVGSGKINGHVLMPGEVLSGYECMQPFTVENGYRAATAYENGRSVDSIGGGVCQISTTLYNASLLAELDIVQRQNHSMTVGYVKPSMDAAIAGTYKDLKIKNPYDTPIYVEGYTKNKTLTFTIYGKETRPSNRSLKFESVTLKVLDAGAPIEQVDNTLAPGTRIKVDSGHRGLRSELYKCVYVDGELTERTLLNKDTYNASKAIYRVGPAVPATADPTAPSESEPGPSVPADPTPSETAPSEPQTEPEKPQQPGPGYNYGPGMEGDVSGAQSSDSGSPEPETPAPEPETPAPGPGGPGGA